MRSLSKLRRWLCARTLARHAGGRGSKPGGGVEFYNNLCKCACAVWVVTILVWVLILACSCLGCTVPTCTHYVKVNMIAVRNMLSKVVIQLRYRLRYEMINDDDIFTRSVMHDTSCMMYLMSPRKIVTSVYLAVCLCILKFWCSALSVNR